jgi:hypothetical protein
MPLTRPTGDRDRKNAASELEFFPHLDPTNILDKYLVSIYLRLLVIALEAGMV